jgi:hypothetical protein
MEVLQIHENCIFLLLLINYQIRQLRSVRIYANDHEWHSILPKWPRPICNYRYCIRVEGLSEATQGTDR